MAYASLYFNQGVWYILYSGKDDLQGSWRIGLAQNSRFWGTYTKYNRNPVLQGTGGVGDWNKDGMLATCLVQINNVFKLYVTGRTGAMTNDSIGLYEITKLGR